MSNLNSAWKLKLVATLPESVILPFFPVSFPSIFHTHIQHALYRRTAHTDTGNDGSTTAECCCTGPHLCNHFARRRDRQSGCRNSEREEIMVLDQQLLCLVISNIGPTIPDIHSFGIRFHQAQFTGNESVSITLALQTQTNTDNLHKLDMTETLSSFQGI